MSPRNPIQNEQIRTDSVQKILSAAYKIMSEKGYDATSISMIAKQAGISKGLMYNYYDSKEDLLKALIDKTLGDSENLMAKIYSEDPAETLSNIFSWFFDELRNNIGEWRFLSGIMLKADKYDFVEKLVQSKLEDYTGLLSELLSQLGFENAPEEARLIGAIFDGIGFQYLVLGENYPLTETEEHLKKKYCKKLTKGKP
jgi:AcrR family transcriptional regulator